MHRKGRLGPNQNPHKSSEEEGPYEPLLTSSVPNLSFDDLFIDPNASGGELNPNSGLGLEAELVPGEPGEEVRFPYARVPNQNNLEEIVVFVVRSVRHCSTVSAVSTTTADRSSTTSTECSS